ncbi:cysteine--tRNA ligase, partial [Candidatus Woesearchaeota archaeon]|nr:cysteine--tRNA ligase [Candidatus Woesearchaeota archaeon]
GKKMSKSLGNFYTLRDLLSQNKAPRAIRFVLLSAHYRQQLNFTFDQLGAADSTIERLDNFMLRLTTSKGEKKNTEKIKKLIKEAETKFEQSMDDDLNIAPALGAVFELILAANKLDLSPKDAELLLEAMHRFDTVLGLLRTEEMVLDDEIQGLIDEREAARKRKDWERADEIRNKLEKAGIILEDTPKGVRWKKKK